MRESYLIDASAVHRLSRNAAVGREWKPLLGRGRISVSEYTQLELGHATSKRVAPGFVENDLLAALMWTLTPDGVPTRAKEVQGMLRERSWHQGPGAMDLLVAATAQLLGLTLLHYDADFETIAKVTGQPHRWIAVRGSVS
ncbi:MAG: PIN domain nuclease [Streptomycetaceae bacterium]|nr:PIN domain nuclease [Streptomycetaceae bacterium]NUS56891.1 PIN domain nuclease [Streptomycetaceae bacterium]